MENIKGFDAKEYLKSKIATLDECSFLSGTEGNVYFVDDSFVVKTYFEPFDDMRIFNEYCKEIRSFGDKGYAVPRIHAWAAIPCLGGERFIAYILEDRVKGKALFDLDVHRLYESCKKFCSKSEFEHAVARKKNNPELLGLIMREHIAEFLSINKALNSLSDAELEKFISSEYNIGVASRFSSLDVQAGNVMFDGKKLTIVDNAYLGYDKGLDTPEQVKTTLIRDMFLLFYYNENINWMPKYKCSVAADLYKMRNENAEECFLAMRRFVRKANEMYRPIITNPFDYEACKMVAYEVFQKDMADELCKEVQKDF